MTVEIDTAAYLRQVDQPGPSGRPVRAGERSFEIVRAWHNDTHRGGFETCDQQPCHAINRPPA